MINSDKFKFQYEFIDPCACNAWVATAVVGSSVVGALATAYSANKAADAQKDAAGKAIAVQQGQYQQTREDLSPYRTIGADASDRLTGKLSELTTPISVNPDDFKNSEMYKFAQTQGEKAVQNSAAARGLGKAGAALKGSAAFESGLNLQNWQQNFNNQVTNQTNAFTRLKGLIDTGAGAATGTGVLGEKAAYNTGTALVGAGNAEAAADNRIGGAFSSAANNIGGYAMYKGLYGGGNGNSVNGGASIYSPQAGQITLGGANGPTAFG